MHARARRKWTGANRSRVSGAPVDARVEPRDERIWTDGSPRYPSIVGASMLPFGLNVCGFSPAVD
eukprot:5127614-Lingulodinium_polyedra.AAC.1